MTFRTVDSRGGALRVVQVGAGGMGRAWLRALADSADVELVGVVDLDLDAARAGAEHHGDASLPVSTDLGALVADLAPDAVVDVTVPVAHHPVTTQSLFAGLPVLGEKPVALDVAEGLSLAAAAEVTGELFMVSQSRRYDDHLVALRQQIGQLETVGVVTTEFFKAPHFGGFREQMDDVLLLDMAVHPFDSVRWLLDADPVSVWCDSFSPSWSWYRGDAAANAVFEFEGGIRYAYSGSWCSPGAETSWNGSWRVSGSAGTALWDGDEAPVLSLADETGASSSPSLPQLPTVGDGIEGSLAAFVGALRTGAVPHGEVHENVMSLAMVEAAIESTRTGQRVVIDDLLERALATAIEREARDDVRARLESWTSVRAALRAVPTSRPGTTTPAATAGATS
ncbi:Gfo/Idh/MocA family oxidoreductase [uncultured Frigoribacterium sp.]|uniref:Gfo/Idh/MocA family protein n=1 Tax=uncultured Frigoribacterium sp. TaxID=335377 RepID=UPI0028D18421|nr:Gfo/Idh/MocA family oxidoreductase [uncultured Frigoribacterium sp.]